MAHPDEAHDRVDEREERRDPEPVAEPVPVEQGVSARLVGERAVVVGIDACLKKRPEVLMDVPRLQDVVQQTEADAPEDRRYAIQQPGAPGLAEQQLSDRETDEREERARLGEHRESRNGADRGRPCRRGPPSPEHGAGQCDEGSDGKVGQTGNDLSRKDGRRDQSECHEETGKRAPIAVPHEPDERAEQQHREEPAEYAPQGLRESHDPPDPALQDVEERPSVLLRSRRCVVQMPVLGHEPRPLPERQGILRMDRNHDGEKERGQQEEPGCAPHDRRGQPQGRDRRHCRSFWPNTIGRASTSTAKP